MPLHRSLNLGYSLHSNKMEPRDSATSATRYSGAHFKICVQRAQTTMKNIFRGPRFSRVRDATTCRAVPCRAAGVRARAFSLQLHTPYTASRPRRGAPGRLAALAPRSRSCPHGTHAQTTRPSIIRVVDDIRLTQSQCHDVDCRAVLRLKCSGGLTRQAHAGPETGREDHGRSARDAPQHCVVASALLAC